MRTKSSKKAPNFIPPLRTTPVPEEKRNETEFRRDLQSWLKDLKASGIFKASSRFVYELPVDKAFLKWCERTINDGDELLHYLFFRYGLPPSFIMESLSNLKLWQLCYEKYSKSSEILRLRRLREGHASILEKAAATLKELPYYILAMEDILGGPSLSQRLHAIAADIRKRNVAGNRRPPATFARFSAQSLANGFKELTGNQLYEYIGELILIAFPEAWTKPRDIREAVRKLVKAGSNGKARPTETRRGKRDAKRRDRRLTKQTAANIERWREKQERIRSSY